MIDVTNEQLLPIRDVSRQLPARPNGKRLHVSVIYRWTMRGIRGIVLESVRIGGTRYTSREALQRFADRLSNPSTDRTPTLPSGTLTRQRQIARAQRAVAKELGLDNSRDNVPPA
jgi:hypothetical protein